MDNGVVTKIADAKEEVSNSAKVSASSLDAAIVSSRNVSAEEASEGKTECKIAKSVKTKSLKMKCYHRFEFLPTGEKLFKCISQQSSQCFDTRIAAQVFIGLLFIINKNPGFKQENNRYIQKELFDNLSIVLCILYRKNI